MPQDQKQELLKRIPSITELLKTEPVLVWLKIHPHELVAECLRHTVAEVRKAVLEDTGGRCAPMHVSPEVILTNASKLLEQKTTPHLRAAINATGVILHTGLGRAVLPESVVDSVSSEMKGYCTLAIDRHSGERIERDELVEYILTELSGAEAATVVCNNAAATMLVLAGLAAQKEVIVSRGQLIEIGGSFRLPEVMAQSQARLVEVGATNRTHLKDYRNAITPNTAALMRVHPSNFRVIGFTSEVELGDMAELAHTSGLITIDDLGAGALLDLQQFGLPHEPTVRESIEAGADIVLCSGDKLIGGSQAGIIFGRKHLIQRLRKHPLMRAVRVDKTCLMLLERTLHLFRNPDRLRKEHPIYRMICTPIDILRQRARALADSITAATTQAKVQILDSTAWLGSGSLPAQAIPSIMLSVSLPPFSASELARQLRLDDACVFTRIEDDLVRLDLRTITDEQLPQIAKAFERIVAAAKIA